MTPRYIKPGEALAMASTHLHQDRKGFFWMMGSGPLPNERRGDVMIVHVRGELEHHKEAYCVAESYEGILEKFRWAYEGQVDGDSDADDAGGPPKSIIMCVDSPGGVVSGLNECVAELLRMRAAHPDVDVSCFVNEMATSAAYALACSCDEIVCPESAIIGSIGVISTMISAAAADKKAGFDVRLLTSGARKADGHLHAPISDAAITVETARVDKLALAFFKLAGKARNLSVKKIQSLQAGIFLGKDAIREGLADDLQSFDDLVTGAQGDDSTQAASGGNQTDRRLKGATMTLNAILRKLAAEDDPKKREALSAKLAASISSTLAGYKKTEKHVEHVKTEEDDEDEDEEEEAAESEEDEKSSKSAKSAKSEEDEKSSKSEEDEKASAKSDDSDDEDDDDDDKDEDDAKSAKKAMALVQSLTGKSGAAGRGELRAIVMLAGKAVADVEGLKKQAKAREKSELIASVTGKYFTPAEAKDLASMPLNEVRSLVAFAKKRGPMVHTESGDLLVPKASGKPGTVESLPQYTRDMIDAAVANASGDKKKIRAELEAAHLKAHNDQIARASNGVAGGRY